MCSHVFEDPGIQNGKLKENDLSNFPLKKCRSTMVKFLTGLSPTVNVTLRAQTCPLSQFTNGGESERDHEEVQQPTHDQKTKDKTKKKWQNSYVAPTFRSFRNSGGNS